MADKPVFEQFVAVDIGSFSLKFAYTVPGSDGKPVLKASAHIIIPPFTHMLTAEEREKMSRDDVEKDALSKLQKFLTKQLTELLYDNQIQTKKAVTLASGRPVTIRYVEIPPAADKEALDVAVNAEAAKQMPFSMENAVLGYSTLGNVTRDEKALQQIMVSALQKDIVAIVNDNLKGGGLTNDGILTLPQALELGIPNQIGLNTKNQKVGVIHVGHKTTSIMVYKNGVLNFYRDINMGGETITEAIFAGGEIDGAKIEFKKVEEAIELKHRLGVLPPDEIKALQGAEKFAANQIFAAVEKIFQHIQLSISFYISQFAESGLEKLVLSGGSAGMKNFKEFIQESLEVPVEMANPFSQVAVSETTTPQEKLQAEASAFAATIGISLYQPHPNIINFMDILYPNRRNQSQAFSQVSSKFGPSLGDRIMALDETKLRAIAGILAVLILLGVSIPIVRKRQEVSKSLVDQKKLQKQLEELKTTQIEVTQLNTDKDRLSKEAGFLDEINSFHFPTSELLLELGKIVPKQVFIRNFTMTKDPTNQRTFRITAHTDTSDRVFELIKILGQSPFFKGSTIETTDEVTIDEKRYFINFAINGKIVIPPKPEKPKEAEQ